MKLLSKSKQIYQVVEHKLLRQRDNVNNLLYYSEGFIKTISTDAAICYAAYYGKRKIIMISVTEIKLLTALFESFAHFSKYLMQFCS